jgi:phage baseplate assembly protein W
LAYLRYGEIMAGTTTYDFGSVGDRLPTLRSHEQTFDDPVKINFNPVTPLKLSYNKSELFVMNTDLGDAITDNLKNLLLTNRGERIMQPDFGANLKAILTEFGTSEFEAEVMTRIKTSVNKYLPYISLQQMKLEKIPSAPATGLTIISIEIVYSIPHIDLKNQQVSVVLNTVA